MLKKERIPVPHKDIFKESDLQVKIADLGNACWTVSLTLESLKLEFYYLN